MFMSTAAMSEQLITLVPLDLLKEVKSLYRLMSSRNGALDRQARTSRRPPPSARLSGVRAGAGDVGVLPGAGLGARGCRHVPEIAQP